MIINGQPPPPSPPRYVTTNPPQLMSNLSSKLLILIDNVGRFCAMFANLPICVFTSISGSWECVELLPKL